MVQRFGDFVLNTKEGTVRRGGSVIALQPLLHRLLSYLAENRGELVTKERLMRDVWGGTYSKGVITTAVGALREALGDPDHTMIVTVWGRGYRFDAVELRRSADSFVGRGDELDRFDALLDSAQPFCVGVHGITGIGKSSVLRAMREHAKAKSYAAPLRFAAHLGTSPRVFLESLETLLRDEKGPVVLFLDDFESLEPIHEWLRIDALPRFELHGFVYASREPAKLDRGRRVGDHDFSLSGLSPEAGARVLLREWTGTPSAEALETSRRWSGHPLALHLLREAKHTSDETLVPDGESYEAALVGLAGRFVVDFPTDAHARALHIAALIPAVDFSMLQELAGHRELAPLLAWLRSLSFVEVALGRVHVHRVPGAALVAHLMREDPETLASIAVEALVALSARLNQIGEHSERIIAGQQAFFIGKHHPQLRPLYDSRATALRIEWMNDAESHSQFLAFADTHHGEVPSQSYGRCLDDDHDLWGVRDEGGELVAAVLVTYSDADSLSARADPLLARTASFFKATKPAKGRVMVHRAMIDVADGLPGPAMQCCMEILHANHQTLPRSDIGESFVVLPAQGPWVVVGEVVADYTKAFDFEQAGRAWPVCYRPMHKGAGEWLQQIARNLAKVPPGAMQL